MIYIMFAHVCHPQVWTGLKTWPLITQTNTEVTISTIKTQMLPVSHMSKTNIQTTSGHAGMTINDHSTSASGESWDRWHKKRNLAKQRHRQFRNMFLHVSWIIFPWLHDGYMQNHANQTKLVCLSAIGLSSGVKTWNILDTFRDY